MIYRLLFCLFLVSCVEEVKPPVTQSVQRQGQVLKNQNVEVGSPIQTLKIAPAATSFEIGTVLNFSCLYQEAGEEQFNDCFELENVTFDTIEGNFSWIPQSIHKNKRFQFVFTVTDGVNSQKIAVIISVKDKDFKPQVKLVNSQDLVINSEIINLRESTQSLTLKDSLSNSSTRDGNEDVIIHYCSFREVQSFVGLKTCDELNLAPLSTNFDFNACGAERFNGSVFQWDTSGGSDFKDRFYQFCFLSTDLKSNKRNQYLLRVKSKSFDNPELDDQPDISVIAGEKATADFNDSGDDKDDDGQSLTYSCEYNDSSNYRPCSFIGARINSQTGVFSWQTHNKLAAGDYEFRISATDSENTDSEDMTVTVISANFYPFKQIAVGAYHVCALNEANAMLCWGENGQGQLGVNSTSDKNKPTLIRAEGELAVTTITAIDAQGNSTCALNDRGNLFCWGKNGEGQLGNATTVDSLKPVMVDRSALAENEVFTQFSMSATHVCALTNHLKAYCWGKNTAGQLGDSTTTDSSIPVLVVTNHISGGLAFKSVAAGGTHSCAIAFNNKTYCWGDDSSGQLGNGSGLESTVALEIDISSSPELIFQKLSLGHDFSCGLVTQGALYCWGNDTDGTVPDGNSGTNAQAPNISSGTQDFIDLDISENHGCALRENGNVACFGLNTDGQLAQGDDVTVSTPTNMIISGIDGFTGFKQLAVGFNNSCAIDAKGRIFCAGNNDSSQLGNRETTDSNTLIETNVSDFLSLTDDLYSQFVTGSSHTCGLKSNGLTYCFGDNNQGQIKADSSLLSSEDPLLIDILSLVGEDLRFKKIQAYGNRTCSLNSQGEVFCWGNGTTLTKMSFSNTFNNFVMGDHFTCGLSFGGAVECIGSLGSDADNFSNALIELKTNGSRLCGLNEDGGIECTLSDTTPEAIDFTGLSANESEVFDFAFNDHTLCFINSRQNVYCQGEGSLGELGNGATDDSGSFVPVDLVSIDSRPIDIWSYAQGFCLRMDNELIYCWGDNRSDKLDLALRKVYSVPTRKY